MTEKEKDEIIKILEWENLISAPEALPYQVTQQSYDEGWIDFDTYEKLINRKLDEDIATKKYQERISELMKRRAQLKGEK